ncbi:MAG TPA: biotin--[acetyl-CoA-carboxylase] ligase, partial [Gemmatimonadales bacterium]|nr:biotin--[acetyl-CoA-carboxylase] ligase [Gemmatimonadales bacterium]
MALPVAAGARRATVQLTRMARAGSTQDLVHQLAEEGAPHGTAIVAEEQVQARGTRGRTWHAPRGGVWMSVLCRPAVPAAAEVLSLRVGLAVAAALEAQAQVSLRLKWPNDLMLGERKLGGILCEARWRGDRLAWVTVGIGINVTNPIPPDVASTAARLADHDPRAAADRLAESVAEAVAGIDGSAAMLTTQELATFAERDWLRGRAIVAPEPGVAAGID